MGMLVNRLVKRDSSQLNAKTMPLFFVIYQKLKEALSCTSLGESNILLALHTYSAISCNYSIFNHINNNSLPI